MYKNGLEILTEGNIYDIKTPFKRTTFDCTHKGSDSEASYIRLLSTTIKADSQFYKEYYDFDIIETGRSSSSTINRFNIFLRISKDDATIRTSSCVDAKSSEGTPRIYLCTKTLNNGDVNIRLIMRNHYGFSKPAVVVNLASPNRLKTNLLSEWKYYTENEFTDISNDCDSTPKELPLDKSVYGNLTVNGNLNLSGNCNVSGYSTFSKNIGVSGNVNFGTVNNKVQEVNVKHLKAYEGIMLAPMVSKPTTNLYNGYTFFYHTLKKIITYYEGKWYDAMGNEVM